MIAHERTAVKYNRQEKTWQAVNGETRSFGSGREAKRLALRFALSCDRPALYDAALRFWLTRHQASEDGQLVDRLLKACSLIVSGHAFDNGRVASQSDPVEVYTTDVDAGGAACTCPDWSNGVLRQAGHPDVKWGGVILNNGQVHCKHTLAQRLAQLLGLELPGEEIPF